jgi:hypothetical protein
MFGSTSRNIKRRVTDAGEALEPFGLFFVAPR